MVELLGRQTFNQEVPGSSPAQPFFRKVIVLQRDWPIAPRHRFKHDYRMITIYIKKYKSVYAKPNSSATLVNNQLVFLLTVGIFNLFCLI